MTCLWHFLDRTVTAPGKRLLRWWVTRPLLLVKDIKQRRVAVEDLLRVAGPGSILAEAEALMKKLPDLERKITRIHAFATASADAQGVAEAWASQRRAVRELVALLQAWRQFDTIRQLLHGLQTDIGSPLLLAVIGDLPDYESPIDGRIVHGRKGRREDFKRTGTRPWEGMEEERKEASRRKFYEEARQDAGIEAAARRAYAQLSPQQRRILERG